MDQCSCRWVAYTGPECAHERTSTFNYTPIPRVEAHFMRHVEFYWVAHPACTSGCNPEKALYPTYRELTANMDEYPYALLDEYLDFELGIPEWTGLCPKCLHMDVCTLRPKYASWFYPARTRLFAWMHVRVVSGTHKLRCWRYTKFLRTFLPSYPQIAGDTTSDPRS
jgi:hypothetical protein